MSNHSIIGDLENGLFFLNKWDFIDEVLICDVSEKKDDTVLYKNLVTPLKKNQKPISYAGFIENIKDVEKAVSVGFDKVVINTKKYELDLLESVKQLFGRQCLILAFDFVHREDGSIAEYLWRERQLKGCSRPKDLLTNIMPGEILINWVNKDGQKVGLSCDLPEFLLPFKDDNIIFSAGATIQQLKNLLKKRKNHLKNGFAIGTALWHQNLE
ncbi:HisA/HisF-related TIM barrel protein [Paracoccaceae bacterium]|nr:HisA/HisF-related TIM barrel protein [Paracoccaceae bacterium]